MGIVAELYDELLKINIHKVIRNLPTTNMRVYSYALFVAEALDMTTEELLARMGFDYKFYTHTDVDISALTAQIHGDYPDMDVTCYKATLKNKAYKTGISLIERRYGIGSGVILRELGFKLDKYSYKVPNLAEFLTQVYPTKTIYGLQKEARIVSLINNKIDKEEETIYDFLLANGFRKMQDGDCRSLAVRIAEELEQFTFNVRDTPLSQDEQQYVAEHELQRRAITGKLLALYPNATITEAGIPQGLLAELTTFAHHVGLTPQQALKSWGFKYNPAVAWEQSVRTIQAVDLVQQVVEVSENVPQAISVAALPAVTESATDIREIFGECITVSATHTEESPAQPPVNLLDMLQKVTELFPDNKLPVGDFEGLQELVAYLKHVEQKTGHSRIDILTFWGFSVSADALVLCG